MRPVEKRYLREFTPAMLGYVAAILACGWLLEGPLAGAPSWSRGVVSLLPVLPIALVVRAIVRVIRDNDELQRRIELEAIAVATMVVGVGYFTLGLLASAGVIAIPGDVAMIWVLPALCAAYGISKLWASRRYR